METLTTFQKCKHIRNMLLIKAVEAMCYSNWSAEFKVTNIEEIKNELKTLETNFGSFKIDPRDLTYSEMEELGFRDWDNKIDGKLIPFWLYPFLADKFEAVTINGKVVNSLDEIDNDHRFGCLGYLVTPKNS